MERQLDVPPFIVFGVDVAVNSTKVFSVATEMQILSSVCTIVELRNIS